VRYAPDCRWLFDHRPGLTGVSEVRLRDFDVLPPGQEVDLANYIERIAAARVAVGAVYLRDPSMGTTLRAPWGTVRHILGFTIPPLEATPAARFRRLTYRWGRQRWTCDSRSRPRWPRPSSWPPDSSSSCGAPGGAGRAVQGPLASPGTSAAEPGRTLNIALNTEPSDLPRLRELGYDLVDGKPDDASVNGVPDGMRAMLWVGNFTCGGFELSYEEFGAAVRRPARHPKVYGWSLSDEPEPCECPRIAGEIRRRADLVEREAPGQVLFISLTDWPMRTVTPDRVNVGLVGLAP
jgi:hypothetical protein